MELCPNAPVAGTICEVVTDPAERLVGATSNAAGGVITNQVGDWLVGGVKSASLELVVGLSHLLESSTSPSLREAWFLGNYNIILGLGIFIAACTFILQIITSLIKGQPGMLARALTGSAVAVIGGFAVLGLVQVLLDATDELANGLLGTTGTGSLTDSLTQIVNQSFAALGPGAWLTTVILGVIFILGAVFLWIVMFLRMMGIYVIAVFAPIAFAGFGLDYSRAWLRRWAEIMGALIFSKVVIYVVFLIALGMMSAIDEQDNIYAATSKLVGASVLLWMAAFSPWAVYRFIGFAGSAAHDLAEHAGGRSAIGAAAGSTVATAVMATRAAGMSGAADAGGSGQSAVSSSSDVARSNSGAGPTTDSGGGEDSSSSSGGSRPSTDPGPESPSSAGSSPGAGPGAGPGAVGGGGEGGGGSTSPGSSSPATPASGSSSGGAAGGSGGAGGGGATAGGSGAAAAAAI